MLILLVRVLFVLFATMVGYTDGQYFFSSIFDGAMPPWFAASLGFGTAITLIAAEQAFRRRFTRSLVAFLIGLGAGLVLTGGGSMLSGINRAARDQLGMSARVVGPQNLGGLTDQVSTPPFAAASGLLLASEGNEWGFGGVVSRNSLRKDPSVF